MEGFAFLLAAPPLVPGFFFFRARVILRTDGPTRPTPRLTVRGKVQHSRTLNRLFSFLLACSVLLLLRAKYGRTG